MSNFIQKAASSRDGTLQRIPYTGSAAGSIAFGTQTRQIRITSSSASCYLISDGSAIAATTAAPSQFLPANVERIVTVQPGQFISFIEAATDGLVTATAGTGWVVELS